MARFCEKCKTGTSSRTHRSRCLKRATSVNLADDWAVMRKLLAKTAEQIVKLEETVGLLARAMCSESQRNIALDQIKKRRPPPERSEAK